MFPLGSVRRLCLLLKPHHNISNSFLREQGERAVGTSEVSVGTRSRGHGHTDTACGTERVWERSGSNSKNYPPRWPEPRLPLGLEPRWQVLPEPLSPIRSTPAPTGPIFWCSSAKGLRLRAPELAGTWPTGEARSKSRCGHWRSPRRACSSTNSTPALSSHSTTLTHALVRILLQNTQKELLLEGRHVQPA